MNNHELVESASAAGFRVLKPRLEIIEASGLVTGDSKWCCWRAEWSGRPKPAKVPYGEGLRRLRVSEPGDWLSFDEACRLFEGGGFDGVGILMGALDFVVGLDLDNCLDDSGQVLAEQSQVVGDFLAVGGYVEISPSGRGLRQFVTGCRLEDYREKTGNLEIYDSDSSRYLTLTGCLYPVGGEAGNMNTSGVQARLEDFIMRYLERIPDAPPLEFDADKFGGTKRTVDEVLGLLRKNNKRGRVTRLLAGDLKDHDGDHSAADLALCCESAYYCRDPQVIDGVMRGSALMRPKWDEARGRQTYGQRTIRKALEAQSKNYDFDQQAKRQEGAESAQAVEKAAGLITGGADLFNGSGRPRQDAWALGEFLLRDKRLLGVCFWDEFAGMVMVTRPLSEALSDRSAPTCAGWLMDDHIAAFARWFGREWRLSLRLDQVRAAVMALAQAVRLNPVQIRLDELAGEWDVVCRLDNWLRDYLGVVDHEEGIDLGPYIRAVGSRWIMSAVARGFQPGCKADAMLVLEGRQGARKSSAIRVLAEAIGPSYFREGFTLQGSKDDQLALRGRLVIEWGELSGLNRHDRNVLKNFLTLTTDAYRQAYSVFERDWPRTAIFAASTNDSGYLSDPTGNRRFWPVRVGRVDLDALKRDAPMIWAEAVIRYKQGARWWLDDNDPADALILSLSNREQASRVGSTFWGELASSLAERLVLGQLFTNDGEQIAEALPRDTFSVLQMRAWLGVSSSQGGSAGAPAHAQGGAEIVIDDRNWPRVAEGLKLAGWEQKKSNGRMRWLLSAEKRDELMRLYGRDVGPVINDVRKARRKHAEAQG